MTAVCILYYRQLSVAEIIVHLKQKITGNLAVEMMILKHGKIKIRHICPERLIRTFSGKILCCFQMKLITINDRKTVAHQKLNLESMPDTFQRMMAEDRIIYRKSSDW